MRRGRRLASAAAAVFLGLGAVVAIAGPAQAHNYLVSSTPSAGQTLTELPARFSVITNDVLLNVGPGAGFGIQIRDAKGLYYGDGCVTVKGPGISAKAALGAPGRYTIVWQVISTDGHPVGNQFAFTWKPADAATPSSGSTTPPDCHGTARPNAAGPVAKAPSGPTNTVDQGTLDAVLWIGGALVAVGIAVVVTILVVSRKNKKRA